MRDVFRAIADPTRRQILDLLADTDPLPLHAVTSRLPMSRTAVSKHLATLKAAGLVEDTRVGRETLYHLNPARLRDVDEWISFYQKFWTRRLDELTSWLDADTAAKEGEDKS